MFNKNHSSSPVLDLTFLFLRILPDLRRLLSYHLQEPPTYSADHNTAVLLPWQRYHWLSWRTGPASKHETGSEGSSSSSVQGLSSRCPPHWPPPSTHSSPRVRRRFHRAGATGSDQSVSSSITWRLSSIFLQCRHNLCHFLEEPFAYWQAESGRPIALMTSDYGRLTAPAPGLTRTISRADCLADTNTAQIASPAPSLD